MAACFSSPWARSVAAPLFIALGVILAGAFGLTASLDRRLSDLRFLLGERVPTGGVVLVDIDARSLAEIGVWPWPRSLHGTLVEEASMRGAAQIAFDIDFSSASNTEADDAFARSLAESSASTFLAAIVQEATPGNEQTLTSYPIDQLLQESWPAAVNVPVDPDGKVRRFPSAVAFGEELMASMPSILANHQPSDALFGIDYSINGARLPRFSFVDVLNGNLPNDALNGKTLIVGATALELRDLFAVPNLGIVSGSTIIALATESLLQGRELTYWRPSPIILILALGALTLACGRLRAWPAAGLLVALGVATEAAAFAAQEGMAVVLATAPLHIMLGGFCLQALLREFGLRQLLLSIARRERDNGQWVLERVVEDGFDGVVLLDERDRVVRLNEAAARLLPMSAPASIGDLPRQMAEAIRQAREAFEETGAVRREPRQGEVACQPGDPRILEYTIAPFRLNAIGAGTSMPALATFVCVTMRDVTDRERAQERMRFLAMHDSLTGLGNRRALEMALSGFQSGEAAGTGGAALLAFDLDRFKAINDVLGHGMGDKVLVEVARRVGALFEDAEVLARVGGDEFTILFAAATEDDARRRGEELVGCLAEPLQIDGHRLSVGASVGIAWSSSGVSFEDVLVRQADLALYQSKRLASGGVTLFRPHMENARLKRLELEQDLATALDNDEFFVVYQPQVSLASGEVTGAEALLRWRHPLKGQISPVDFIPVAEEMGLIHRLGAWVLAEACREAAAWPLPVKVAVNVSSIQFETGDLVAAVRTALEASGLPVERLELEITESAFVMESERLRMIFEQLLELGTSFALDDFGTGYSSLGYLHRFPISKIKIDRAFVAGVPADANAMAILRSIRALALGLGVRTIAEGIETEAQAEVLRVLGCEDGQGWLYSKPIDGEAFRHLLEESTTHAEHPAAAVA